MSLGSRVARMGLVPTEAPAPGALFLETFPCRAQGLDIARSTVCPGIRAEGFISLMVRF